MLGKGRDVGVCIELELAKAVENGVANLFEDGEGVALMEEEMEED